MDNSQTSENFIPEPERSAQLSQQSLRAQVLQSLRDYSPWPVASLLGEDLNDICAPMQSDTPLDHDKLMVGIEDSDLDMHLFSFVRQMEALYRAGKLNEFPACMFWASWGDGKPDWRIRGHALPNWLAFAANDPLDLLGLALLDAEDADIGLWLFWYVNDGGAPVPVVLAADEGARRSCAWLVDARSQKWTPLNSPELAIEFFRLTRRQDLSEARSRQLLGVAEKPLESYEDEGPYALELLQALRDICAPLGTACLELTDLG